MRSSNKNRSRNKNGRKSLGNIINRVFESAGPEGKVRGTPQQIIEKYTMLARDAHTSGDRVAVENFQQHAEHYIRLLAEAQREAGIRQDPQALGQPGGPLSYDDDMMDEPQHEQQPRQDQPRHEQQPRQDQQPRHEQQPRQDRQDRREQQARNEPKARPDPQPQPEPQPVSPLATIEPDEDGLAGTGLVETPEGRIAAAPVAAEDAPAPRPRTRAPRRRTSRAKDAAAAEAPDAAPDPAPTPVPGEVAAG